MELKQSLFVKNAKIIMAGMHSQIMLNLKVIKKQKKMTKNNLFNIINEYPWHEINAQVGYCEDIPQSIRMLVDENPNARENGYWGLDNHVVVQSDLYEGAFYTIPFLLAMLHLDETFDASYLYALLSEFSNASARLEHVVSYKEININNELKYYKKISFNDDSIIALPLGIACRNTILTGFTLFIEEVKTNRLNSRIAAMDLLCSFEEHQYLVTSSLRALYDDQQDYEFKKLIENTICSWFANETTRL
jgi:hypothetical protein